MGPPIYRSGLLATLATAWLAATAQAAPLPSPAQPPAQPLTLTLQVQEQPQHATVFEPPPPTIAAPTLRGSVGRRPAVVVLHSGFSGDESTSAELARTLTGLGFVTVMPSYRGERRALDGARSGGRVEFCSGEVDDVERVLDWLRRRDDVDAMRIGLVGMSHGGCIALRTAVRQPRLRAVATIAAPVAAGPLIEHLIAEPYEFFFYNGILAEQLRHYVRGPDPLEIPAGSYAVRSPLFLAGKLTMPLAIFHGSSDHIVPPEQACWLAQVLGRNGRPPTERWLGRDGAPLPSHPRHCPLPTDGAQAPAAPRTELWYVEGQDHIFFSPSAKRGAQSRAIEFLKEELMAPGGSPAY